MNSPKLTAVSTRRWVELMRDVLSLLGVASLMLLLVAIYDGSLMKRATPRESVLTTAERPTLAVAEEEKFVFNVEETHLEPLNKEQRTAAKWLSKKYRVATHAVENIVRDAWAAANEAKLDPYLVLAVISIESSFNPFAESPVGAQGLMQVMTRVHADKFDAYGGEPAALHPAANIQVGARILKDYLVRTGDVALALKHYVGAANLPDDGGYAAKVLTERARIAAAATGKPIPDSLIVPTLSKTPPAPKPVTAPVIEADASEGLLLPTIASAEKS